LSRHPLARSAVLARQLRQEAEEQAWCHGRELGADTDDSNGIE
jgi:hypothetical protein